MGLEQISNGIEIIKIGDKYSEDGVEGFVFEKKGNSNGGMDSELFSRGISAYNSGASDHVLVWSKKYNQLLRISKEK